MMEREIKFRAWRDREMVEFELGECLVDRKEKILDFRSIPVMQFTGLKDKNGKEIWEGDVLNAEADNQFNFPTRGFVEFMNGSFCINVGQQKAFEDQTYYAYFWSHKNFEVIGNIFENHELLKP